MSPRAMRTYTPPAMVCETCRKPVRMGRDGYWLHTAKQPVRLYHRIVPVAA